MATVTDKITLAETGSVDVNPPDDEIMRAEAARFDFQLRAYVGGKYALANLDALVVGDTYNPTVSTNLDGDVDPDDVVITVDDTTGFASAGTIVIIPAASDEHLEIVGYASKTGTTFVGCTRGRFTDGQSGYHSDGDEVQQWYDITGFLVDGMTISVEERDGASWWEAQIEGINYNARLFDNDNAILLQWRFRPANGDISTWTDWTTAFIGYIRACDLNADYTRQRRWRASIEGLSQYVRSTDLPAHQFGRYDLAEGATVTVSSYLEDPLQEADSEFIGYPELDGSQLVDSDMTTLWISDGEPASTPDSQVASVWSINEVYLRPPVGYSDPDHQWIEIAFKNVGDPPPGGELKTLCLVNKNTTWKWAGWDPDERIPANNYVQLPEYSMVGEGSFVIIARNKAAFLELWSGCDEAQVLDWRQHVIGEFSLDVEGDFIGLHEWGYSRRSIVWYGDLTPYYYTGESGDGTGWTGATVPVPPRHHTFRRNPDGNKGFPIDDASYFKADEDHPTPGAYITGDPEYASVDCGTLDITLTQTLLVGTTTYMYLTGTQGFTEGPAYVKIESEIIKYETRDDGTDQLVTLTRGEYGTTPAEHAADTPVYQYEDPETYNIHLVASVVWKRPAGNTVVPKNFRLYVTTSTSPIYPDDEDWDDDWELYWQLVSSVEENTEGFWQCTFTDPKRARHVMLCVLDMSDAGRVKLNELNVYSATLEVIGGDGSGGDVDGAWSGDVIQYLLEESFGLDPSLFTMTDRGRQFDSLPTTKTRAMQVITDLAKKTGCTVQFNLDHTVEHRFDALYPLMGPGTVCIHWTTGNSRSCSLELPYRHNISQVILRAQVPMEDIRFEVRWPQEPLALGSTLEVEGQVVGNADDARALAEMIWRQRNAPLRVSITPNGPAEWVRPGQRHLVTWDLDTEGIYLERRNFIVRSVVFNAAFGGLGAAPKNWVTSISMQEMAW